MKKITWVLLAAIILCSCAVGGGVPEAIGKYSHRQYYTAVSSRNEAVTYAKYFYDGAVETDGALYEMTSDDYERIVYMVEEIEEIVFGDGADGELYEKYDFDKSSIDIADLFFTENVKCTDGKYETFSLYLFDNGTGTLYLFEKK